MRAPLKQVLAEIRYRKGNFVLSALGIAVAVMLFIAGPVMLDAYQQETRGQLAESEALVTQLKREVADLEADVHRVETQTATELAQLGDQTRRLMRDMGFNLMIVHRDTDMSDFWAADFAANDMPQEYVHRLAKDQHLTLVTHLVATLQGKITWNNRKVLLVGYLPETTQAHLAQKSPMGYNVKPGTVLVGYELAAGRKVGDSIDVAGRPLRIARILPEQGSKEDITLAVNLADAQAILNKAGRVNQIMALGCQCAGSSLPNIRQQLTESLPEAKVSEFHSIALARAEQRTLVEAKQNQILAAMKDSLRRRQQTLAQQEKTMADLAAGRARIGSLLATLASVVTPLVTIASAIWVGVLALVNVRQRQAELGLLRALGKGSGVIASLFLAKAALLGLAGAAAGILLGYAVARWFIHGGLASGAGVSLSYALPLAALFGAPLLAIVATWLPMLAALSEDPAAALREA